MIKLTDLLKEVQNKPKAIIMAGGASVGKSTVLKTIDSQLKGFENLNADKYVEDKDSPMFGNLSAASNQIRKQDLPGAIAAKRNLIYDTTASNLSTLQPTLDMLNEGGYDIMMIMVYAHPIVSFLRNYKRERKVPAAGVLGTWGNVYNLLDEYKNIFKDNFVLVRTPAGPEEEAEIANFEKAYQNGKLKEYFDNLLSTGQFTSSFRKDDTELSPEEKAKREKSREKTKQQLYQNINKIANTYGDIQSKLDPLNPIESKQLSTVVNNFIK
jgi:predicted AAA+ superfamily ATPase